MIPLTLVLTVGLVGWGSHVLVPWRLRTAAAAARTPWCLGALPLLMLAVVAGVVRLRMNPDAVFVMGLGGLGGSWLARSAMLTVFSLLACDLVLALGGRELETWGWRAAAMLGSLNLAAVSLAGELLRIGEGPSPGIGPLLAGAACRLVFALAAGQLLTPGAGSWRLDLAAALAVLLYTAILPAAIRSPLAARGLVASAAVIIILLVLAHRLPRDWPRAARAAATLLAAACLALATLESAGLPSPTRMLLR